MNKLQPEIIAGLFVAIIFLGLSASIYSEVKQEGYSPDELALWDRAYLASYPRSGNTWTRDLIEESSRIITTTVYVSGLHKNEFPWGGYEGRNSYQSRLKDLIIRPAVRGEIALVKTHFPVFEKAVFDELPYSCTIRLVRHPVDSFYSYYSWRQTKTKAELKAMIPRLYLEQEIQNWRKFQEYWNAQPNVITIRYEDLYNDPSSYLKMMIDALGYEVTDEDIARALAKNPPNGQLLKHLVHFTDDDLLLIQTELSDLLEAFGYEITSVNYPYNPPQ